MRQLPKQTCPVDPPYETKGQDIHAKTSTGLWMELSSQARRGLVSEAQGCSMQFLLYLPVGTPGLNLVVKGLLV